MNSVCVINASIPYFRDDSAGTREEGASEFIELLNTSIEQGAAVLDLGVVASGTPVGGSIERLARILSDMRDIYPDAIFQATARSLAELNHLIEHCSALAPDVVSVPLSVFCGEDAVAILSSRDDQLQRLRSRLVLDLHDLSMLFRAVTMQNDGLLDGPLRVNFCFGQEFGVPSDRHAFSFFVQTIRRLAPEATWSGIGRGKSELELARWSMDMGGHCRATVVTGQNANGAQGERETATLSRVTQLCREYGRRPASFAEARRVLLLDRATQISLA
jgi:3-keto-5-aminohexanoate cleavage enzyme